MAQGQNSENENLFPQLRHLCFEIWHLQVSCEEGNRLRSQVARFQGVTVLGQNSEEENQCPQFQHLISGDTRLQGRCEEGHCEERGDLLQ